MKEFREFFAEIGRLQIHQKPNKKKKEKPKY